MWADLSSSYPHWLLGYYPASSPIRQPLSPKTDKNISRSHFFLTFFLLSFSLSLSHFGCSLSLSSHLTNGVQHQLRLFQEFLGVGRGLHCIGPASLWTHQNHRPVCCFHQITDEFFPDEYFLGTFEQESCQDTLLTLKRCCLVGIDAQIINFDQWSSAKH